jgi:hypothetical protein
VKGSNSKEQEMKARLVGMVFLVCCAPGLIAQNNAELKELEIENQAAQENKQVQRTDKDRAMRVLELLAKGRVQTPEDKFNAAIVLQHTPADLCEGRIISKGAYNYLLAHYLAREAYESGFQPARTLVAQSIDRYMSMTEGRQKYGTNRFINQKTGKEELAPIDRSVPDSERAKYGVPPLAELLKQWPEQKIENKGPQEKTGK